MGSRPGPALRAATNLRLEWLDRPRGVDEACVLCGNGDGNAVFLVMHEATQAVTSGGLVDVARCGGCSSAWFPGVQIDDSYPRADPELLTDDLWVLVDHYVELVGGLDWKVAFVERLRHADTVRVLEVGCSIGVLLDYLRRAWGADVHGLEPSVYGLAGAIRLGLPIEPCYMADLIATAPEPFDLVLATEVIEHTRDPGAFLRELRALVRPGGRALITTPNAHGLTSATAPGDLYAILSIGAHHSVLSADRLDALARDAGFDWVHIDADPITLVAYLADEPQELAPIPDPRHHLLRFYGERLTDPSPSRPAERSRLADLIARYVVAHELDRPDRSADAPEVDEMLRDRYHIDLVDLAPFVERVAGAADIFALGRLAPFSLPRYLRYRALDETLPDRARTEMLEAAVVYVAHGVRVDPVNLSMLTHSLDPVLGLLVQRPPGRLHDAAASAIAQTPELAHRRVRRTPAVRVRNALGSARRAIRERSVGTQPGGQQ